jgi:hypothetical protein
VDEEETAANGEMFKDARLQERLFDQIHASEFNLEDDFRTAEVGSVISSIDYRDDSFQRVDDGDGGEAGGAPRVREPIAAHIESFVDDVDENRLQGGTFQPPALRNPELENSLAVWAERRRLRLNDRQAKRPRKNPSRRARALTMQRWKPTLPMRTQVWTSLDREPSLPREGAADDVVDQAKQVLQLTAMPPAPIQGVRKRRKRATNLRLRLL